MNQPNKSGKKRGGIANMILLMVGLGFLSWTLWNNRQVLSDVFSRPIQYQYYLLGFVLVNIAALISFLRWYALVRMLGVNFKLIDCLRLSYVGSFFNLVIPGAVGGDLVKAAYLARMNLPRTQAITTLLIDRIVGLIGLFYLASLASIVGWQNLSPPVRNFGLFAILMAFSGTVALVIILLDIPNRLLPKLVENKGKIGILAHEFGLLSKSYRSKWQKVVLTLVVSMFCHALTCAACYLVGRALFPDFQVSLGKHLLIFPLVLFSTAVPLPFGALGFSEEISGQLFQFVGHPSGAVAMMGYRVLTYGLGVISMIIYLWNINAIRDLTRQSEAETPSDQT
jgi:uncharacterized protein (TIRG00374 family)